MQLHRIEASLAGVLCGCPIVDDSRSDLFKTDMACGADRVLETAGRECFQTGVHRGRGGRQLAIEKVGMRDRPGVGKLREDCAALGTHCRRVTTHHRALD